MLGIGVAALASALVASAAPSSSSRPVVVVDPGHDRHANSATEPIGPGSSRRKIKDGGGTRGAVTGIHEADLVLDVSLRLRRLLEGAGVRVVLTRSQTAGVSIGNIARARIANRARADLFVRVHADGHPSSNVRGSHTLVPALRAGWTDDVYAASRRAGRLVQAELARATRFPNRGLTERADFTGFNWADVPVILVEMGFMTNPAEDRQLARAAVRQRVAVGLCRGVLRAIGERPARCRV